MSGTKMGRKMMTNQPLSDRELLEHACDSG